MALIPVTAVSILNTNEDEHLKISMVLTDEHDRLLYISIGPCEAKVLTMAIDHEDFPRPLTHNLMLNLIQECGYVVNRVVIDDFSNGIYFSRLVLINENEPAIYLDCRPSDAVILALLNYAPIFAEESMFDNDEIGTAG
jgi:bifunctional DNase/RNase